MDVELKGMGRDMQDLEEGESVDEISAGENFPSTGDAMEQVDVA